MTVVAAFRAFGPDVPKIAAMLGIRQEDADRLKNYMMDHKPLTPRQHKHINERARGMVKRQELRVIREKHRVAA